MKWLLIALAVAAAVSGLAILAVLYRGKKRRLARIEGLTRYMEAINLGRESVLTCREDEFSHLEDELYKTVGELRHAKENTAAERQRMADNLAHIAHQIKTPITSMSMMTELLAEGQSDENSGYTTRLSTQLTRLESLANSLLTLSRLDAGALVFSRQPIDLYALLSTAAEPVGELLAQRGQTLQIAADCELSLCIDLSWSSEALLNLIKNCSEHTPMGGCIAVRFDQNPLYTEIVIEDDGEGFDPADLPNIFRRFYRAKNAQKDSIGIGLALARSIVEAQDGTLHAENRQPHGARFIIRFYNG